MGFAIVVALAPTSVGHVDPDEKLPYEDSTGASGGFANAGMDANHQLRVVSSLKGLAPLTTYDVWIISCAAGPGDHACGAGPLTGVGPFGTVGSTAGCPFEAGGGPLKTLATNAVGNANTGAVMVDLSGVDAGTYFAHLDVGTGCHPDGAAPPGFFFTPGFSFEV